MSYIFVYFAHSASVRNKILCIRQVQRKSENPQQAVAVRKCHACESLEIPSIRKFSGNEIFWVTQTTDANMGKGVTVRMNIDDKKGASGVKKKSQVTSC